MVLINKAINEVTVKLVYYGPGLCGKTTNLEKIYANPKLENKGKMISMSTETDRTLFFDFMPMELGTIAGQKVRVQLYTVPGQVFYDATRKLVLRGADGVVFVADSQASMRESNIESLENLKTNLKINNIDPKKIALVFQCNKRDLPGVSSVDEMSAYLGAGNAPVVEAAAIEGKGVAATLRAAVSRILDNMKNNVDTSLGLDSPAAPDMSVRSGVTSSSAGVPKLSMRGTTAAPPPPAIPLADASPFDAVAAAAVLGDEAVDAVEEVPFENIEVTPEAADEDPFAHESGEQNVDLQSMLASARQVIAALEAALTKAREHERAIAARLGGK
jgi:mutual gliding-motility protein MglA